MTESQYVIFSLEDEMYAIDIFKVNEINRLREVNIAKMPKVPEMIEGIMNLRGDVVPIINLRKKFGRMGKEMTKKTRIIIVKMEDKFVGLLVDGVLTVDRFHTSEIIQPPEEVKKGNQYVIGIVKKEENMLFVVDVDKIIYNVDENIN